MGTTSLEILPGCSLFSFPEEIPGPLRSANCLLHQKACYQEEKEMILIDKPLKEHGDPKRKVHSLI